MLELSSITPGNEDPGNDSFVAEFGGTETPPEKNWGIYWTIALAMVLILIFSPVVNISYTYKAIISAVLVATFWFLKG